MRPDSHPIMKHPEQTLPSFHEVDRILRLAEDAAEAYQRTERSLTAALTVAKTGLFLAVSGGLLVVYHQISGSTGSDWLAVFLAALLGLMPVIVFVLTANKKRRSSRIEYLFVGGQVLKALAYPELPDKTNWSSLQQFEYELRESVLKDSLKNVA